MVREGNAPFDMNAPVSLDELRAPLESARRMFFLRTAACIASGFGLLVVLVEAWIALSLLEKNPASWTKVLRIVPAGLALTLLGAAAGALFAWKRHRAIGTVADRAQKQFPELGLRLSASLEAPALQYCPPAIRAALWRDALTRLAGTPWKKFTGRGRAIFWAGLALAIIFFHASLSFPLLLRRALPRKIENFVRTRIAKEPFRPRLEIVFPNKDQWATRMDSIPLMVRAESAEGLSRLRLKVSVNGEPVRALPFQQDAPDQDTGEAAGSLDLDELKVKDYDVVSYSVVAEAQRPDGRPMEVASPMFFVQIEPFHKDVPVADALPTDGLRKFVDLVNLLADEQRQAVRAAWRLQSLEPQSEAHRETVASLIETQKRIAERAREACEQAVQMFGDAVSKELLMDLDEARTHMEIALRHLEKQEWSAALSSEQKALSGLVDILRDMEEAARKDMELFAQNQPDAAAPPTRAVSSGPSDLKQQTSDLRQMFQRLSALQNGLQQNEGRAPEKQAAAARNLAGAKDDLKTMSDRPQAVAPDTLKDAAQKAGEAAKFFSENKGVAETLASPMEAVARAYEQTVGRAARLAQLQQEMRELKEQMRMVQQKLGKYRAPSHPSSQNQPEQRQDARDEKTADAKSQEPPNPQDRSPEQKSSAEPHDKPTSDPRAAAGDGGADPKNPAKEADSTPSEAVRDWMKSFAERSGSLQIELRVSLGITEGLKQLDQALKQHNLPLQGPVNHWTVYGGAYAGLGDWIKAVSRLQTELDAQLQAVSQRDLLRAMQNEDAPPEYREMVNAYFERLSRETATSAFNKEKQRSVNVRP